MPDIRVAHANGSNAVKTLVDMGDGTHAEKWVASNINALGQTRVRGESTSLFGEEFDALDTVTRWTIKNSGGSVTAATGTLTVSGSTTVNAWGGLESQPTFQAIGLNLLEFGGVFLFPNISIANTKRFFGMGTIPATPTLTTPITDGFGFELDGSGGLSAVIYESGVRSPRSVNITALAGLANNTPIPFIMARRADTLLFFVTNNQTPDASIPLPGLDVTALPLAFLAVNGSPAPASSPSFVCFGVGIGDTGCNASSVKDPVNPWLQAAVTKPSTTVAVNQSALAVALHPLSSAGTPAAPATPFILNSLAGTNGALIATGSSGLQAFYATNIGATVAFVKLYNKATAPTVGTDVPAMIIAVPAAVAGVPGSAQITAGFIGHRFALGLGIAITGAVGDADSTAVAAGQVKVILSRTV
jgi:hypothetical protein